MRKSLITILTAAAAIALTASGAHAQLQQANETHGECKQFQNDGTAYNGYPAKLNATLYFNSISSISGTIYGQNWKSGLPEQRNITTADWRNGGYLGGSFGNTGGWKSAFFYVGAKPPSGQEFAKGKDIFDIRFGAQDGLSPGKASSPKSTQPLYIVQRNRDMALKNDGMTLAGFNLTICGVVDGPPIE